MSFKSIMKISMKKFNARFSKQSYVFLDLHILNDLKCFHLLSVVIIIVLFLRNFEITMLDSVITQVDFALKRKVSKGCKI